MNIYECDFTIDYDSVDYKNELSIYSFFKYLEEVGCRHASLLGFGLYDVPKTGFVWILLNWKIKIIKKPRWNEKINVKTWPSKAELAACYRDYEIYDKNYNLIAIATSKWVLFDVNKKKISRIVPEVLQAFAPNNIRVFDEEIEKISEPESFEYSFDYTVLRKDIDTNEHVNNLNYLNFALETLPEEIYKNINFSNIEVMYKKQCLLGDKIKCLYSNINKSHIITIKNEDLSTIHAIVKMDE